MDRNSVDWRGYWVAAPTPFDRSGALDEGAWRALLRMYLADGIHGILVNGTTGEWFAQTPAERRRVAEIAVEELGGRMPVVIGCTTYTAADTAELGGHAQAIGADGILSTPPPYAVPTPREIVAFYRDVAEAVDLPLMVYNWARGVVVEITADTAAELAAIERVAAIKDSTANRAQAMETLQRVVGQVRVFGGFINRPGLALLREIGGDGNIDGAGLGARFAVRFYEAFWAGDLPAARAAADAYTALMSRLINPDWSGRFGSPQAQIKAAMNLLGQPGGYPRRPLLPIEDPEALAALKGVLRESGL
ncbi:MAG: dihydrodipicolinate synthase family protein [Proteobacteria bacterium]|nr:dihydrodipicolinate synthase family protein [Pseudomonadota bacterium]